MPSVTMLNRFPVKSMLGERPRALVLDERGVRGDRLWAVRTASGKYGAGKHTSRFRRVPGLWTIRARYDGDVPCLTFPDGRVCRGDDPRVHELLSRELGQALRLVREGPVSLLDAGPGLVHVMTTGSIAHARRLLPGSVVDERRFRPNLLVSWNGEAEPVEDRWVGRILTVGTARLTVVERTERCVMVNHAREGLPRDGTVLKTLAAATGMRLGVYARVTTPGVVGLRDVVRVD